MKNNIAIISLSNNYSRQVGKELANFLELFYVDMNDILEYNLVNNQMLDVAGVEYFEREKQKVIKSVADFDNSLVVGDIDLFLANYNIDVFSSKFIIIYLYCSQSELEIIENNFEIKRQFVAFNEEDKICKRFADVVVNVNNNPNKLISEIRKSIINYVEGKK